MQEQYSQNILYALRQTGAANYLINIEYNLLYLRIYIMDQEQAWSISPLTGILTSKFA